VVVRLSCDDHVIGPSVRSPCNIGIVIQLELWLQLEEVTVGDVGGGSDFVGLDW